VNAIKDQFTITVDDEESAALNNKEDNGHTTPVETITLVRKQTLSKSVISKSTKLQRAIQNIMPIQKTIITQ